MTKTDVCNLALCRIGEALIDDIDDTGDRRARLAKLNYEASLKEMLRGHFWGFAMVMKPLVAVDIDGLAEPLEALGWTSAWEVPTDFLKLREVMTADGGKVDKFDFRRLDGAKCLVAGDYETLNLHYVAMIDVPDDYDPAFTAAFVTLLAARLARPISGSEKLEEELLRLYHSVDLPAARTADAHDTQSNENHPLQELLAGSLTGLRGNFFNDEDF